MSLAWAQFGHKLVAYRLTSSARASGDGGTVGLSAFTVFIVAARNKCEGSGASPARGTVRR